MASSANRSQYFDNAKFLLIFLVVFGHLISPIKEKDGILFTLYSFIFLFHMPAFILISGYFAKSFKKKGYLFNCMKKILVPYLIFQMIYSIFYYLNGHEESIQFNLLDPHWTLWFLISLFFWNVFLYVFAYLRWWGLMAAVGLGIAIGYYDDAGSFLSLSRTFVFFPYFLLGFLIEGKHLKAILTTKFSRPIGIVVMVAILLVFATGFPKDAIPWLLGDTSYAGMGGQELTDGLIRAAQYGITLITIFGFLTLIPSKRLKFTVIGERTIYVYLLHGFIIKGIHGLIPDKILAAMPGNYLFLILISLLICITLGSYLIKKYTRPIIELTR